MADDKRGRDKQAQDAERRQQERDLATELERGDEPEPAVEAESLADLEAELEAVAFPATGAEIVAAVGDREIGAGQRRHRLAELVPETDEETFDSTAAVRALVQRPTVARAMKRVVEASRTLGKPDANWTQRKAYELTFQELEAIDASDDDEGIGVVTDWILAHVDEKGSLPSSRAVRRRAAKFCRANGYEVRTDEWLGV